jgi:hypothetical protein
MSHWQAAPDVALSRQQHKTLFQAQGRYLRRLGLIALAGLLYYVWFLPGSAFPPIRHSTASRKLAVTSCVCLSGMTLCTGRFATTSPKLP